MSMSSGTGMYEEVSNPLDCVEDVLSSQQWVFDRPTTDELVLRIGGEAGAYNITFLWQEEYSAMQFFCEYDFSVPEDRRKMACQALGRINESLWLGHFDVSEKTGIPCFRHTSLFRGMVHSSGADHVQDLVDIALAECMRHHNAFKMLAAAETCPTDDMMDFVLKDSVGEA